MATLTTEKVAEYFSKNLEVKTAEFINQRANKIYCANYSTGQYGRIFSKFITDNFYSKLNLNGGSTDIAFEITRQLEAKGYKFIHENSNITFAKENILC